MPVLEQLTAGEVADYLRRHPHFLADYPGLATALRVPREHGAAASLVAYQLEALRARNSDLTERLTILIANASENEDLMVRVHTLTAGLLRAVTLADTCGRFIAALHEDFNTRHVRLALFRERGELPASDWLLTTGRAPALPAFTEFLRRGEPACGRLAQDKLAFLFGSDAERVQSAALLKIGGQGLLAIGSEDADRFHPGIGTLFLKLIAQSLDAAISRFPVS